jgi:hypothetical protein
MSPREVEGLQKLAVAHGTTLTINPDTGLPEAFSLSDALPFLATLAGVPPVWAAGASVAASVLGGEDLGKSVQRGITAYTLGSLGEGIAGLGAGALSAEAGAAASRGLEGVAADRAAEQAITTRLADASMLDKLGAGASKAMSDPMSALSAIGGGSKLKGGAMLAGAIAPMFAGEVGNTVQTTTPRPRVVSRSTDRFDPYSQTYGRKSNEGYNPYAQQYAAKGGLMGLAHGGAVGYADGGVAEMYQSVLGRAPDAGGAAFWQQQFGDTVDANELAAFKQSALGGTDTADKTAAQAFGAPASTTGQGFAAAAPAAQNFGGQGAIGNNLANMASVRDAQADEAAFTAAGNAANNAGIAALPNAIGEDRLIALPAPVAGNNVMSQQQGPLITDQVYDLFKNVLDRPPSQSDMDYWATAFGKNNNTIDPNEVADFKSAAQKEIAARTADFDSSKNYIPISKLDDLYMQELSRHGEYGKDGKEGGMEFWRRTFGDYIDPQELAGFRVEAAKERAAREKATMPDVVTDLTTADTTYVKPGVGGSTGAGQIGGGTVINPNGTITTSPRIPGIPVGGFTGMDQARTAYTTGGGSLGYTSPTYTKAEFDAKYKNTGYQKEMYDYLMGKGDKPTKMKNADGTFREIMRPYKEATLGVPGSTNKRLTWDAGKGEYFRNPDYVRTARAPILDAAGKPKRDSDGNIQYNTTTYKSINQAKADIADNKLTKDSGSALFDWATQNNVDEQTVADALGIPLQNVLGIFSKAKSDATKKDKVNGKNGGLMSLASGGMAYDNGGSVKPDFTNSKGEVFIWDWENGEYRPKELIENGKTYTWDKILNRYKLAGAGTGIASLVDGGPPAGGENPPNTTPDWGTALSIGQTLSNIGLTTIGDYLQSEARMGINTQTGAYSQPSQNQRAAEAAAMAAQVANAAGGNTGLPSSLVGQSDQEGMTLNPNPTGPMGAISSPVSRGLSDTAPALSATLSSGIPSSVVADAFTNAMTGATTYSNATIADALANVMSGAVEAPNPAERKAAESYENRFGVADRAQAAALAARNGQPGGGDVPEGNEGGGYGGLGGAYSDGGGDPALNAKGGYIGHYAQGGLGSLGGYSDGGRLLRGPGDGVSDSIPASIGNRQPARLADGEFVVPARIVSELGNGSTEAGARALYKMMDRIQANRRKTTGKNSVAVDSKAHKYLPA